jgi:hypothetical protein
MQEHATNDFSKNLQSNGCYKTLKCGDHVKSELKEEDPVIGVTSTTYTSVERVENMSESKMKTNSGGGYVRNKNTVSLTRPDSYKLRSSNFEKRKKLTTHDITQNGFLVNSHFEEDETTNSLNNSTKTPFTSCLNGHKHSDLGKHLSKHANSRKRGVQENSVEQLSKPSAKSEILKPVGSKKETKKSGQLQKSHLFINYLEDGNKANCSVPCIKSTTKSSMEFEYTKDIHSINVNMGESKMKTNSGGGRVRNKDTVSLIRPDSYKLRSSSFEKQKKFTTHDVKQNGVLVNSHFEEDETTNSLNNSTKTPLTSCLNGHKHSDLGKHLSKHANSRKREVQENSVEQLSKPSAKSEILKPVGSKKETKKSGQLRKSRLCINYLEDGNKANCSVPCIKSTTKSSMEFEYTRDIHFISNVDIHYKVQNKECSENSHYRDFHRNSLRKEAVYQNNICIRPCYVKLVKLQDIAQQTRISPCKINSRLISRKASAVHSRGSNSLSCKAHGNKISCSQYRGVVDPEGCKVLHNSDRKTKLKPRRTISWQMKTRYSSSRGRAKDNGIVAKSVIKQTCVSVSGGMSNVEQCGSTQAKPRGDIKNSGNNISFLNMISEQFPSNVACDSIEGFVDHEKTDVCPVSLHIPTKAKKKNQFDKVAIRGRSIAVSKTRNKSNSKATKTAVQESEFGQSVVEIRNKILHIQEQCEIKQREGPRRETVKGKEHRSEKLLNNLQPDKFNVLSEMKPFSICLERLDQSVLEKYSVTLSSKTTPRKNTGFLQQEVTSTSNKAKSYCDVHRKHIARSQKLNHIHCQDKIPCLDGVFDSSSSDDCSESRSIDHFEQSGKSPVTKKARRQEKIIQEVENKLTDLQHKNTDHCNSSVLVETSLQKPGFESPAENLNWKKTIASSETRSPVRSPRKSLYPALAINIQKSPKKRNVVTEKKFEVGSDISELIDISGPRSTDSSSKGGGSRLSGGEETKVTRLKHAAVEQKLTSVQIQEQPKDMCDIFKNRKRKSSSTSVHPSHTFHKSHLMATEVAVPSSSICHSIRTTENRQNTSAEKHMYVMTTFNATCSFSLG